MRSLHNFVAIFLASFSLIFNGEHPSVNAAEEVKSENLPTYSHVYSFAYDGTEPSSASASASASTATVSDIKWRHINALTAVHDDAMAISHRYRVDAPIGHERSTVSMFSKVSAITETLALDWTASFDLSIDDMFILATGDVAVMSTSVANHSSGSGNTDFRWLTLNRGDGTVKSDVSWVGDERESVYDGVSCSDDRADKTQPFVVGAIAVDLPVVSGEETPDRVTNAMFVSRCNGALRVRRFTRDAHNGGTDDRAVRVVRLKKSGVFAVVALHKRRAAGKADSGNDLAVHIIGRSQNLERSLVMGHVPVHDVRVAIVTDEDDVLVCGGLASRTWTDEDSYCVKFSEDGTIQGSRRYGARVESVIQLGSGAGSGSGEAAPFMIAGSLEPARDGANRPSMLAKLNADLSIEWVRSSEPNTPRAPAEYAPMAKPHAFTQDITHLARASHGPGYVVSGYVHVLEKEPSPVLMKVMNSDPPMHTDCAPSTNVEIYNEVLLATNTAGMSKLAPLSGIVYDDITSNGKEETNVDGGRVSREQYAVDLKVYNFCADEFYCQENREVCALPTTNPSDSAAAENATAAPPSSLILTGAGIFSICVVAFFILVTMMIRSVVMSGWFQTLNEYGEYEPVTFKTLAHALFAFPRRDSRILPNAEVRERLAPSKEDAHQLALETQREVREYNLESQPMVTALVDPETEKSRSSREERHERQMESRRRKHGGRSHSVRFESYPEELGLASAASSLDDDTEGGDTSESTRSGSGGRRRKGGKQGRSHSMLLPEELEIKLEEAALQTKTKRTPKKYLKKLTSKLKKVGKSSKSKNKQSGGSPKTTKSGGSSPKKKNRLPLSGILHTSGKYNPPHLVNFTHERLESSEEASAQSDSTSFGLFADNPARGDYPSLSAIGSDEREETESRSSPSRRRALSPQMLSPAKGKNKGGKEKTKAPLRAHRRHTHMSFAESSAATALLAGRRERGKGGGSGSTLIDARHHSTSAVPSMSLSMAKDRFAIETSSSSSRDTTSGSSSSPCSGDDSSSVNTSRRLTEATVNKSSSEENEEDDLDSTRRSTSLTSVEGGHASHASLSSSGPDDESSYSASSSSRSFASSSSSSGDQRQQRPQSGDDDDAGQRQSEVMATKIFDSEKSTSYVPSQTSMHLAAYRSLPPPSGGYPTTAAYCYPQGVTGIAPYGGGYDKSMSRWTLSGPVPPFSFSSGAGGQSGDEPAAAIYKHEPGLREPSKSNKREFHEQVRAGGGDRRRSRSPIARAAGDAEERSRSHQRRRITAAAGGGNSASASIDAYGLSGGLNENSTSEILFDNTGGSAIVGTLPMFMGMGAGNAFSMAEHSSSLPGTLPLGGSSSASSPQGQSSMAMESSAAMRDEFMRKSLASFREDFSKSYSPGIGGISGFGSGGGILPTKLRGTTPAPGADSAASSSSTTPAVIGSSPMQMVGVSDEASRSASSGSGGGGADSGAEGIEAEERVTPAELDTKHLSSEMPDDSDVDSDFGGFQDPHLSYPSLDDKDFGGLAGGATTDPAAARTGEAAGGDEGDAGAGGMMGGKRMAGSASKPFPCQYCEKGFKYLRGLNRHMNQKHHQMSERCHLCDRPFTAKYSLTRHLKTQLHCGKMFEALCDHAEPRRHTRQMYSTRDPKGKQQLDFDLLYKAYEEQFGTRDTTAAITIPRHPAAKKLSYSSYHHHHHHNPHAAMQQQMNMHAAMQQQFGAPGGGMPVISANGGIKMQQPPMMGAPGASAAVGGGGIIPKLEVSPHAAVSSDVASTGDGGSATSSPPRSPTEQHLPVMSHDDIATMASYAAASASRGTSISSATMSPSASRMTPSASPGNAGGVRTLAPPLGDIAPSSSPSPPATMYRRSPGAHQRHARSMSSAATGNSEPRDSVGSVDSSAAGGYSSASASASPSEGGVSHERQLQLHRIFASHQAHAAANARRRMRASHSPPTQRLIAAETDVICSTCNQRVPRAQYQQHVDAHKSTSFPGVTDEQLVHLRKRFEELQARGMSKEEAAQATVHQFAVKKQQQQQQQQEGHQTPTAAAGGESMPPPTPTPSMPEITMRQRELDEHRMKLAQYQAPFTAAAAAIQHVQRPIPRPQVQQVSKLAAMAAAQAATSAMSPRQPHTPTSAMLAERRDGIVPQVGRQSSPSPQRLMSGLGGAANRKAEVERLRAQIENDERERSQQRTEVDETAALLNLMPENERAVIRKLLDSMQNLSPDAVTKMLSSIAHNSSQQQQQQQQQQSGYTPATSSPSHSATPHPHASMPRSPSPRRMHMPPPGMMMPPNQQQQQPVAAAAMLAAAQQHRADQFSAAAMGSADPHQALQAFLNGMRTPMSSQQQPLPQHHNSHFHQQQPPQQHPSSGNFAAMQAQFLRQFPNQQMPGNGNLFGYQ